MKRRTSLILLSLCFLSAAVISCYSCTPGNNPQQDVTEPEDNGKKDPDDGENKDDPTVEPTGPQAGTYNFVASALQGTWKEGDKIYVHGNIGTQVQVVTLSASDISNDGKTATAVLSEECVQSPADPDGLYAAWPADAVYAYKGILKTKTTFLDCEDLLTVAYLEDDTFTFADISSLISFSIDGDYDRYAIASNSRDGICITRFEAQYSSAAKTLTPKQNSGYPFRYGSITPGNPVRICFPGDFSFPQGYTIYLGKGDDWTASYSVDGAVVLTAGKVLDLGNISATAVPYSGMPPKMPVMGEEVRYSVSFNELSGVCLSEDGEFLWGVGDDGDLAKLDFEGKVLYKFHIGGDSEDVSVNPETHDLLIGLEPDGVGVVKGPDFNTRATTLFNIPAAKNYGNAGVEGCTYFKDGLVFAGAQSNSHLFLCSLETKTVLWDAKLYDRNRVSEIAGFSYDPKTGWLWIIDSEAKKVFVFDVDYTVNDGKYSVSMDYLGAYPVSGSNPESVCIDRVHSCMWVGDDYGDTSYLYRYDFTGFEDFDKN